MTSDPAAQADALERQVQALRLLAADTELPRLVSELQELSEQAQRISARIVKAQAELGEVRAQAAHLRRARAARLRDLANAGAPLSALATHVDMSVASVRASLYAPDSDEDGTEETEGERGSEGPSDSITPEEQYQPTSTM